MPFGQSGFQAPRVNVGPLLSTGATTLIDILASAVGGFVGSRFDRDDREVAGPPAPIPVENLEAILRASDPSLQLGGGGACPSLFRGGATPMRVSPVPWFPIQGPNGKWFFFGHLGTPTFSKLKKPRRHHHHRSGR